MNRQRAEAVKTHYHGDPDLFPENTNTHKKKADPLGERILIGELIHEGIEPPVFLEMDVLIEGMLHWVYGDSESGKTWLALWLTKRRIEAKESRRTRRGRWYAARGWGCEGARGMNLRSDPYILNRRLAQLHELPPIAATLLLKFTDEDLDALDYASRTSRDAYSMTLNGIVHRLTEDKGKVR